jgi:hypothetical protein
MLVFMDFNRIFGWIFDLFGPLMRLIFPKEQERQMPRQGIGAGARAFGGALMRQHRFASLARKGWIMQARRPVGQNPELPRSSMQRMPVRTPIAHRIGPRASLPVNSRLKPGGFFSVPSRQKQRLRRI